MDILRRDRNAAEKAIPDHPVIAVSGAIRHKAFVNKKNVGLIPWDHAFMLGKSPIEILRGLPS